MVSHWQNVTDPIFDYAATRPNAPAFIEGHRWMNYRDLAALVAKASVYHHSLGIRPGDRVAICLTNSIDHFILTLGLLRLGATTMEVAHNSQQGVAPALLQKFGVRTLFIEPAAAPPEGVRSITLDLSWRSEIARLSGDRRYPGSGDEVYTISLTSGTTGEAKGSLTAQSQYFLRLKAYTELFRESGVFSAENPANFLLIASVAYTTFFRRMLSHLFIGGPTVIFPEFAHLIDMVKAASSWENALFFVTSAFARTLLGFAPREGLLFPRLRAMVAGGGMLYPEDKLQILERVTPHFYESYGASGFGTVSVLSPEAIRQKPASVGRPPSFVEVEAVDGHGNRLAPGSVGRIRCRGSESKGFAAEGDLEGDERFRDGWYYPGDVGSLGADGYIFLKGRAVDLIQRSSAIFASEIEAVIAQHSGVAEVAVVGFPRSGRGDEIVAVVVTRGGDVHDALAEHCRQALPRERWPDRVFYTGSLPKTAGGKLDRAQVRGMALSEMQRQQPG